MILDILEIIQEWKAEGYKVVFTNGVFDILHLGHLHCLETAKSYGSKLIVAINDDESVKRLGKGDNRPINSEKNRAKLLTGLSCVDLVLIFSEDTPLEAINLIEPDVLVKGGDYDAGCTDTKNSTYVVGSNEVRVYGGEVRTVPLLPGQSTTNILNSLLL